MRSSTRMRTVGLVSIGCFAVGLLLGGAQRSHSLDLGGVLGDAIKVGGIGLVVSQFDDQIDKAINSILSQKGIEAQGMTKVVPIIRVGSKGGTQVGAAQVVGPAQQVRTVKAVAELQLNLGALRGRGLIPIATKNPLKGEIKGVGGVGVSANVRVRI